MFLTFVVPTLGVLHGKATLYLLGFSQSIPSFLFPKLGK
jgi:hypothetical protein